MIAWMSSHLYDRHIWWWHQWQSAQHFSCGLGSLNSILRPWSVLLLYPCGPITFLWHRLPHMSVTPTCGSVSFPLWHGDACPCDSEGGESVTHANSIGQLYVCLLAISCEPGHLDIGSCPLWFLSLELGEDLTPCLWHRNLMHPWERFLSQEPSPKKKKDMTSGRSWRIPPPSVRSNVHCGITDDCGNWHCITNLTYSSEADDSFPADELKTLESLSSGKGDLRLMWSAYSVVGMTLKIHGDHLCSLVNLEFCLIRQGERGGLQIENNWGDYGNICNVWWM